VIGFTCFLLPFSVLTVGLSIPYFLQAFHSGEMSSNAGGLIRWPVYLLIPVGFFLLGLQGISELIKRVAFLKGLIDDPTRKKTEKTAEEELAEFVRAQQEKAGARQ
jgi:TRAP-type mannitol/chloroaromatic compound transport system permease small subunit